MLVSTTTHIRIPEENYVEDMAGIMKLWEKGCYAVTGAIDEKAPGKLVFPDTELYMAAQSMADLILLESDGAKCLPCKVPRKGEPIIVMDCKLVIGVMGMSALGREMGECCFRFDSDGKWLGVSSDHLLDEEVAVKILSSEMGTRKSVDDRRYIVVLNQCDNEEILARAERISSTLASEHRIESVCCSLQSGQHMG
ncbi:MAG: putative selenium-dependent hydroxylase accessory protein YqeC [Eubacterium sp.]|nr:putative selenium-dependent hydroxylase accessory protein YqeC [Candidatus Colimonas fimequi]